MLGIVDLQVESSVADQVAIHAAAQASVSVRRRTAAYLDLRRAGCKMVEAVRIRGAVAPLIR